MKSPENNILTPNWWLLERFTTNLALARHEARLKLRFQNERATDLFALTVLLCDGFLRLNQVSSFLSNSVQNDSERFFSIAHKLPGIADDLVPSRRRVKPGKHLVTKLGACLPVPRSVPSLLQPRSNKEGKIRAWEGFPPRDQNLPSILS